MSPAGRQSGEYPVPVTQEQFGGFTEEFRGFAKDVKGWMAEVNRQLSDGQATMAVLRQDSASYVKRSDEASSKINLLTQKEAVRADRERQAERRIPSSAFGTPVPKPTVWEKFKEDLINNIIKLVALAVIVVGYHEVAVFMAAHPSITPDGEGFTAPKHDRGREPIQTIPASAPISAPKPP